MSSHLLNSDLLLQVLPAGQQVIAQAHDGVVTCQGPHITEALGNSEPKSGDDESGIIRNGIDKNRLDSLGRMIGP